MKITGFRKRLSRLIENLGDDGFTIDDCFSLSGLRCPYCNQYGMKITIRSFSSETAEAFSVHVDEKKSIMFTHKCSQCFRKFDEYYTKPIKPEVALALDMLYANPEACYEFWTSFKTGKRDYVSLNTMMDEFYCFANQVHKYKKLENGREICIYCGEWLNE